MSFRQQPKIEKSLKQTPTNVVCNNKPERKRSMGECPCDITVRDPAENHKTLGKLSYGEGTENLINLNSWAWALTLTFDKCKGNSDSH